MRSAHFLVVPSLLLGLVSAQSSVSEPANTTGSLVAQRQEQHTPTECPTEGRDTGETTAFTLAMSSSIGQHIPWAASANDSCFPQSEVIPLTVAIYFLAEAAAKRHQLKSVMGQCEMYWDQDKINTCIVIGNGAMVCQGTQHLPGCRELHNLLDEQDVGKLFGRYSNNVTQVVDDLYELPDNQALCRHDEGKELERCANIMQAALACTLGPATTDCDRLSGALRCHGLWVPGTVPNHTVGNRRRSLSGIGPVSLQESDVPDPVNAHIGEALDQLRQADLDELCKDPQEGEELRACIRLLSLVMRCLFDWHTRCEEVADFLDQNGVHIPGINDDEDSGGDNPFSSLDDLDPDVLEEVVALLDGADSDELSISSQCQDVCEQDPDPVTGINVSCLICVLLATDN